jgi:hypothetical protein
MNIRPGENEMFHAVGQTDMTTLRDAFRNFAYAPNTRKEILNKEYIAVHKYYGIHRVD